MEQSLTPLVADSNPVTERRKRPWFELIYLVFAYLPLAFNPNTRFSGLLATVLACVVFLPLFSGFYLRKGNASPLWWITAVAGIGYALIPINVGGNTFIIYAMAMAASAMSVRSALLVCVLLVMAITIEFAWVIPSLRIALSLGAMVASIGGIVVAGIMVARARERRDAELHLTQDEVRRLAAMAERERIGRDLHDLLGHTLSVVALKSELAGKLIARDPIAARTQILEVETVARDALAQVREAVTGIRAAGLQAELASARLALLSVDVHLDQRLVPMQIAPHIEQALAFAVREAITNVLRHAGAQRVEIELLEFDDALQLSISDDGRGGIESPGTGLSGMRERITALGGSLVIDSTKDAGTRLLMRLPQHRREESEG